MMSRSRLMFAMALVATPGLGCDKDGNEKQCGALDEQQCEAARDCKGERGRQTLEGASCWSDEFAFCYPKETGCSDSVWYARGPDGACWIFTQICDPEGDWEEDEECVPGFGSTGTTTSYGECE